MRPLLRRLHLWLALVCGLYIVGVSVTGAVLLFRVDIQRARHPLLFTPAATGPLADPVTVMERVSRAYPEHRLSGVEAPTSRRPTTLAYVTRGPEFVTVLIDPVSAGILGELPEDRLVRALQSVHFNLTGGRTGRTINGIGAVCLFVLCVTGLVLARPGRARTDGKSRTWRLHRVTGLWTAAFTMMFAVTGFAFAFPAAFRSAVHAISPITTVRPPQSAGARGAVPAPWRGMVERARRERPGQHVARVVLPFNDRAAFQVMFAAEAPTPSGTALSTVYLDQYSGEVMAIPEASRTFGDIVMAWITPLHVGGAGGAPLRWLWFLLALMPPFLLVSGLTMWRARTKRALMNK